MSGATSDGPKLTGAGKFLIVVFILGCLGGAFYLYRGKTKLGNASETSSASSGIFAGSGVEIGIAYGTEKKRWLEWAVQEFAKTSDGNRIKVNLIGLGSLEGAHAILSGDKRINVWTPASATYKDAFIQDWQVKYNTNPILKEDTLALTPMVFVMWDERYQSFIQKYKTVSFSTVNQALQEKSGWSGIAGKPEWGLFKFGQTNPNESNSGLLTIVQAAYTYHNKTKDLLLPDILDQGFQQWLGKMQRGASGFSNSTGNMMREMVLKGPSTYDVLFAYEAVAIDYLKNAEGRWGKIRVVYPEYNAWNENPYYILNADWSSAEQRKAAQAFLNFLLSDPVQKEALNHGYRPANPAIPVKFPESPFVQLASSGVQVDLQKICEPPKAEVVNNLLQVWQRNQGDR
ncbi:MAG TPA: substrate-binding domain-containing protein [Candidatus Angelobacter sp.]|nr:substrate-binding domain-containing protein [Candidatus Angelobacter sp.]